MIKSNKIKTTMLSILLCTLCFFFMLPQARSQTYDYQGMQDVENLLDYCLTRYDSQKDGWWGAARQPKWMNGHTCEEFLPKADATDFLTVDQFNDIWIKHGGSKTLVGDVSDHRTFSHQSLDVNEHRLAFLELLKKNFFGKRNIRKIDEVFRDRPLWMLPVTYGYLSKCQENGTESIKFLREYISKNNFLQFGGIGFTDAQISLFTAGQNAYGTTHPQDEVKICSLLEEKTQKYANQYVSALKDEIIKTSKIQHQCGNLKSIDRFSPGRMQSRLGNRLQIPTALNSVSPAQSDEDIECEKYYYGLMQQIRIKVEKVKSAYQDQISADLYKAEENQFIRGDSESSQAKIDKSDQSSPAFTDSQRLILRQVMSVGGKITKDMHETFWNDVQMDAKGQWNPVFLWLLENAKISQVYQSELWKSALQSYEQQKVIHTPELEDISKKLEQHSRESSPFEKGSADYKAFIQSYEMERKTAEENARRLLEAAASRTNLQSVQGESIEISDVGIRVILDGMNSGFERLKRLMRPEWQE
ncbi:MAG: hypothetical protein JNK24_08145 [Alphaproteobacteria bacterium]|nr:hypothetical protein [Alphaproteobacteria bacterium]